MKLTAMIALLFLTGCQDTCWPCKTADNKNGFAFYWNGARTHCMPCETAKGKEAAAIKRVFNAVVKKLEG